MEEEPQCKQCGCGKLDEYSNTYLRELNREAMFRERVDGELKECGRQESE